MMDSRLDSFTLPQILPTTAAPSPVLVAQSQNTPLRVVVQSTSLGADVLLAFDAATLQPAPAVTGTFRIPAGQSQTFVLAPGQKLYGASPSAGCTISIAVSEALPIDGRA